MITNRIKPGRTSGKGAYCPRVEFEDRRSGSHQFTSNICNDAISFQQGQTVTVIYDAQDPDSSANIKSFWQLWAVPLFFLVFGLGFSAVGGFFVYLSIEPWLRRNRRTAGKIPPSPGPKT